jgi:general secretion pathway protein G
MKCKRSFRAAGFTLLEIMLVVMIIALLAGAAIYSMSPSRIVAEDVRIDGDIKTIGISLMSYQGMCGSLPTTEQGLKALTTAPQPKPPRWRKLMDKIPLDPFQKEYHYIQPGVHNPDGYDLFTAGKDHVAGTPDDVGNWDKQ